MGFSKIQWLNKMESLFVLWLMDQCSEWQFQILRNHYVQETSTLFPDITLSLIAYHCVLISDSPCLTSWLKVFWLNCGCNVIVTIHNDNLSLVKKLSGVLNNFITISRNILLITSILTGEWWMKLTDKKKNN